MGINISAFGYGGGALCIVGSVLLAVLQNANWPIFLVAGIFLVVFGALLRKM